LLGFATARSTKKSKRSHTKRPERPRWRCGLLISASFFRPTRPPFLSSFPKNLPIPFIDSLSPQPLIPYQSVTPARLPLAGVTVGKKQDKSRTCGQTEPPRLAPAWGCSAHRGVTGVISQAEDAKILHLKSRSQLMTIGIDQRSFHAYSLPRFERRRWDEPD